jgi:hypothetical protein
VRDAGSVMCRILVTKPSILRGVETAQNIFVHSVLYFFLNSETSLMKDSKYFDQNFQRLSESLL